MHSGKQTPLFAGMRSVWVSILFFWLLFCALFDEAKTDFSLENGRSTMKMLNASR